MAEERKIKAGRDYFEHVEGDITTGESVSKHKDTKTGGSPADVAPSESETSERSDPS
jgi:hypothetical protein